MKPDPEGVEKAARAMKAAYLEGHTPLDAAAAALTVYFSHLRESGKMREAFGYDGFGDDNWQTYTSTLHSRTRDFPALIIRTEKE